MSKILLNVEVELVQLEIRKLSALLQKINKFEMTLNKEAADKKQKLETWLQDNINLLGSYIVDDVANNLDTNKSVIANISVMASNINAILLREKGYANIDLSNVLLDPAQAGKLLTVAQDGTITYTDPASGGGDWTEINDLWTNPLQFEKYKDKDIRITFGNLEEEKTYLSIHENEALNFGVNSNGILQTYFYYSIDRNKQNKISTISLKDGKVIDTYDITRIEVK